MNKRRGNTEKRLPGDTILWRFARLFGAPLLRRKFRIYCTGGVPEPPLILVANHVAFWDPFLLGAVIEYPMAWVAARGVFENRYLAPLVKAVEAIPKRKARPDAETVKYIFKALKQGGAVGVFPEGNITWTGAFGHMYSGIDKLLDRMGVPVLGVRIKGAWLKQPRWADKDRRGPIYLEFATFKGSEALDFIKHNEWNWQKKNRIAYKGKDKAAGVTRILWICPNCTRFGTFTTRGNQFECQSCNRVGEVDDFGYLDGRDGIEIYKEQQALLQRYLDDFTSIRVPRVEAVLIDEKEPARQERIKGDLILKKHVMELGDRCFKLEDIKRETTFMRKMLEFYHRGIFIRMKLRYSSFLICKSLEILKKELSHGLEHDR